MESRAITLDMTASSLVQRRCRGIGDLLAGVNGVQSDGSPVSPSSLQGVLDPLWERGGLAFDSASQGTSGEDGRVTVRYIAGDAAVRAVVKAEDPAPTSGSVEKRHRKQLRTSEGAIFRFPLEADPSTHLDVFITDWSPSPAGCALAVHRDHPILRRAPEPPRRDAGTAFAGLYVRHPLTGDLLPVWVADWVKPDFGTGAVLVNPAHDSVDLAFGRRIGLPIRFALDEQPDSDAPDSWQTPPVIQRGRTVKTGLHDGLDVATARQRYFDVLAARELAYAHTDAKMPSQDIAWLEPDPSGDWLFDEATGRLRLADAQTAAGERERRVALQPSGGLVAAAALQQGNVPTVIVPYAEIEGEFLAFRLLCSELDIAAAGRVNPVYVRDVQVGGDQDGAVDPLALLVAANPEEQAVIRQQLVEQVDTFIARHRELEAKGAATDDQASQRQAQDIGGRLREAQTASAFAALYKWQKDLHRGDAPPPPAYFEVARTLVAAAENGEVRA